MRNGPTFSGCFVFSVFAHVGACVFDGIVSVFLLFVRVFVCVHTCAYVVVVDDGFVVCSCSWLECLLCCPSPHVRSVPHLLHSLPVPSLN